MAPKNTSTHAWKKGDRVRVWWPPTSDKQKTDYAGASSSAHVCCHMQRYSEEEEKTTTVTRAADTGPFPSQRTFPWLIQVCFGQLR
jgi:hypothetical protein